MGNHPKNNLPHYTLTLLESRWTKTYEELGSCLTRNNYSEEQKEIIRQALMWMEGDNYSKINRFLDMLESIRKGR